ncbi:BirA family transcriptional regulator, biotin operon repressor / biotin-[acetyl-CoA-carboxylase] ligase [Clostridium acidisoli DSM 12555]|uniref:Bifunctional ligase/repressor BirA n=1 Tax=Clostridium acidisoli DSM 12555 TaxID=1121291 RepID=A0A1W1X807_9CLOT|nr:biotin--[acetyl-CoA-carboxylase] ligase [Clostridium acidisoli]SMC20049.1 BirA family transcriptional regulator, biotin operon repressor / biotin-[acetyl-CoA-carboxylase] ligase [Clostridium acidisoli DSM 12555]
MKSDMLKLLKKNKDEYVSGSNIGESFGVTRTAIWKYINKLKEEGYEIESVPKLGYKLLKCPDILTYEEIKDQLETETIGRNVVHFDTVGSTNEKAKSLALAAKHGTVVISEEQTGGKGRLGRNFVSPKNKGIWMSIILKPDVEPMKVSLITQIGAAAVNNALLNMGIESLIKWPNDIIINNKKVCGILTEMSCELTMVNYVVLGIGINVNVDSEDFGEDVSKVATSLKLETKRAVDRKKLTGYILNNFERLYENYVEKDDITESISICKNKSILIGKEIRVIKKGEAKKANALDIKTNGSLVVQYESGEIEELISGEVSIRGKENYV